MADAHHQTRPGQQCGLRANGGPRECLAVRQGHQYPSADPSVFRRRSPGQCPGPGAEHDRATTTQTNPDRPALHGGRQAGLSFRHPGKAKRRRCSWIFDTRHESILDGRRDVNRANNQLFDAYFTQDTMREIFSDQGRVQGMLVFEAALARAQASIGLIPKEVLADIEAACRAGLFDFDELAVAIGDAGNSAITLVKALNRKVAARNEVAERYLHLAATSQDVMDTGLVLQLRAAVQLLERDLKQLADSLSTQAQRYAGTPLAGRTWLQQATPVTLGMKIAGWLGAVTRHRQRLNEIKPRLLCLQFGGASGSLAALGDQELPVAEALARELKLHLPEQPWHTQRDRLVEFASLLGMIAGSLGKVGRSE